MKNGISQNYSKNLYPRNREKMYRLHQNKRKTKIFQIGSQVPQSKKPNLMEETPRKLNGRGTI